MNCYLKYFNTLNAIRGNLKLTCRNISGINCWNAELSSETKHQIEKYWVDKIPTEKYNENDSSKEKYYVLSMFPYPSGHLHMGHVRVYTISDSVARFQRMNGKNVIHPIGWDAFGLPAENAAIERKIAPDEWTKDNIAAMKSQLQRLGCSFEWDREISTCDPDYYKWTQELFLKLFDAGLIYQKEAQVNWDPIDQTVLADEQVDQNGCSWRSGAQVERKLLRQWFVRTTYFAKDLLDGLDDPILKDWKDITKLQKHWIGECNGVLIDFQLFINEKPNDFISLWSDTPEYFDEAKFVVISENHILAKNDEGTIIDANTRKLNAHVLNPLNKEKISIFVSNLIEFHESTDTYLGIPISKEKDKEFANKYGIPYTEELTILSDSEILDKRTLIMEKAKNLKVGGYWSSAKLRDWLISRQRYWGTPIPITHCDKCGVQPVKREDLPVKLPKLDKLSQKGASMLEESNDWVNTTCGKCGGKATRETDTMDTFVDSSWYFLRYLDPKYKEDMFDVEKAKKMSPVDLYIGGKEHAVLHLYYARFVSHFLHSLGLLPEREPFKRLLVQGMVMGRSYRIKGTGQYLHESEVNIIDLKRNKAESKKSGEAVVVQWEKMSKSKYNGTDPNDMFNQYGVDTTRLLILADVAPTSHRNWNSNTFPGILNWQHRLWLTISDFIKHRNELPKMISDDEFKAQDDYMFDSRNYYVKGVTFNYVSSQQISVAISKLQGLTNSIRRAPPAVFAYSLQFERALACQIIQLAPMAPHFASELWSGFTSVSHKLNNNSNEIIWDKGVLEQPWPDIDDHYNLDLVCQINGNENAVIKMPRSEIDKLPRNEAISIALNQKEIKELLKLRTVLDIEYTIHSGYESVVNIRTASPPRKIQEKKIEEIS